MKDNKYVSINIETIDQLKKILKDKRYNNFAIKIVNDLIMVTGLKQENTKTSGGVKPPKVSLRDLFIQFMNKEEQRWERQEEFNKRQEQRWERQEEFNKMVLDQFKKHKWIE